MPINGVKGPSPLINLDNFNIVDGQSVDYLHCLLQGVTKQLTEAMLESSALRCYIGMWYHFLGKGRQSHFHVEAFKLNRAQKFSFKWICSTE